MSKIRSLIIEFEFDFGFGLIEALEQDTGFAYFVAGHKTTTFTVLFVDRLAFLLDFDFFC